MIFFGIRTKLIETVEVLYAGFVLISVTVNTPYGLVPIFPKVIVDIIAS